MAKRPKAAVGVSLEHRILDEAERLFGEHGVDAVALRQVASAAGSANHFAVQYHFGDKDQLIRAIFDRRLPALEMRRATLLGEVSRHGEAGDTRVLLEVMFRPIAELVDSRGKRTYAAFLLGLHHFIGPTNPRVQIRGLDPVTQYLSDLLYATAPHVPPKLARERLMAVFLMYLRQLVSWERQQSDARTPSNSLEGLLTEALNMATAAFLCEVGMPSESLAPGAAQA